MALQTDIENVILHFGEMGSRWGINRTVGQMYALLFLSEEALNAEQISDTLQISRSNVSMGLKELQAWRLVRLKHIAGDRRDYFSTPDDVLEIALILMQERRKRELDPTLTLLRDTLMHTGGDGQVEYAYERMGQMCDLMEQTARWADELSAMDRVTLERLIKMGAVAQKVLDFKSGLSGKASRVKK